MKDHGLVFGQKCTGSLGRYDPGSHSLKMSQCSLFGEEHELLQILPKSGMMRNGRLWAQTTWVRGTKGKEFGLWPTPMAQEGPGGQVCKLTDAVQIQMGIIPKYYKPTGKENFPTPTTQEVEHPEAELTETGRRKTKDGKDSHSLNLADTVKMFPTPTATERSGTNPKTGRGEGLSKVVKMFPTPSKGMYKQDVNDNGRYARWVQEKGYQVMLPAAVKIFPTPTATDSKTHWNDKKRFDSLTAEINRKKTEEQVTGQLNPNWVEWLMGYPTGWTDLKDLETQ